MIRALIKLFGFVAGRDHPNRGPARRLLERVRAGQIDACTSTEVLQEIFYRYTGDRIEGLLFEVEGLGIAAATLR
jgi:predicted nucleic acid-binding protein